jgi:hypothetical protein
MVLNATFNNISVISWWSVLLEEENRVSVTDYFIQGVRKDNLCLREENLFYHINIRFYFYTSV